MFVDKIFERISEISFLNPHKVAIREGDSEYTYRQFKEGIISCRIQIENLQKNGNGTASVGLYCDNSFVSHCAIYACALERITYVPLSVTDPMDRVLTIIKLTGLQFVLYDGIFFKKIEPQIISSGIQFIEVNTEQIGEVSQKYHGYESDLYILFTSGSTGQPKGISIRHESVENYLAWAGNYLSVVPEDNFLSHSKMTFDLSVFNMFLPFMFGASTVLARSFADQAYPGELLKKSITIALVVPRVTNLLIQSKQLFNESFPALRHLLFCGEQLFAHQVLSWMSTHSAISVHNIYGPTETTVTCTYHTIGPNEKVSDPIPIGKVIPNMKVSFLDKNFKIIDSAEIEAEAVISGVGVSQKDYIGQKSDRFFNHELLGRCFRSGDILYRDKNNILFWRARVDFQLKIRGYRVELSEIEIVLISSHKINDAICIYDTEKEKLYAFIECKGNIDNLELELRGIACEKLPEYMNPQVYIFLPELPRNQNGKIDRKKLLNICI